MPETTKPVLIFTWGNPSRGDDALGPRLYDLLQNEALTDVEVLTDFQLQIEHAVDLENRKRVLFVDASVSAKPPFEFYRVKPVQDNSYSSHAMSPESLLEVYQKVNKQGPPDSFMLSIRGYEYGLGLPMSDKATSNLTNALAFIKQLLATSLTEDWEDLVKELETSRTQIQ